MGEIRLILKGHPYNEPRFYGKINWSERDVYLRHPNGGKDSRHKDGICYFSSTDDKRKVETRISTSNVSRELVNYIELPQSLTEPPIYKKNIRSNDLILSTNSAGKAPRIAVEVVSNKRLKGVLGAYKSQSLSNVCLFKDKGLDQHLVVSIVGSNTTAPST